MKLAIYWVQESWGGVDTHLIHLLKNLPQDVQVDIYSNLNNQGLDRVKLALNEKSNVKFFPFKALSHASAVDFFGFNKFMRLLARVMFYFLMPMFFLLQKYQAKKLLKTKKYDVLLANNGAYPGAWGCLAALIAGYSLGIPQRLLLIHHRGTPPSQFRKWFDRQVDRWVAASVTKIIYVSQATRQTVLESRSKCLEQTSHQVIYNAVDLSPVLIDRMASIEKYNIDTQKFNLGIFGRVELYKGHLDLIEAVALLPLFLQKRLQVYIVGPSTAEHREILEQKIKKLQLIPQFIFTGYLKENPLNLMQVMNAVVVATRDFEGFGLTLAEAMTLKIPVIATKVGAIPEFIENEKNGLLVNPMSPHELAQAIQRLMEHPASGQTLGQNGFEVIKNFSASKMAQQFMDIFQGS